MTILEKLNWLLTAGITECIQETPDCKVKPPLKKEPTDTNASAKSSTEPSAESAVALANLLAKEADRPDILYQKMSSFNECPLKKTAAHTLCGRGATTKPIVMCIGDVPDATDDRQNQTFSGETGALLERMLNAIDLSLSKNTYVTNLIPWRPAGDRKPTEAETAQCLPFLKRQIELMQPSCLLLFGNLTADSLLHISSVSKARGTKHLYQNETGTLSIPTFVTFHPTTVLKMPSHRKLAWEDLQKMQAFLTEVGLI